MAIAEGGPEVDMPALPELAQFVVPLIQGSVHQIHDLQLVTAIADYSGCLTLIARRSSQRPGVRHWRRGAATDVSAPSHYGSVLLPLYVGYHGCCQNFHNSTHLVQLRGHPLCELCLADK